MKLAVTSIVLMLQFPLAWSQPQAVITPADTEARHIVTMVGAGFAAAMTICFNNYINTPDAKQETLERCTRKARDARMLILQTLGVQW